MYRLAACTLLGAQLVACSDHLEGGRELADAESLPSIGGLAPQADEAISALVQDQLLNRTVRLSASGEMGQQDAVLTLCPGGLVLEGSTRLAAAWQVTSSEELTLRLFNGDPAPSTVREVLAERSIEVDETYAVVGIGGEPVESLPERAADCTRAATPQLGLPGSGAGPTPVPPPCLQAVSRVTLRPDTVRLGPGGRAGAFFVDVTLQCTARTDTTVNLTSSVPYVGDVCPGLDSCAPGVSVWTSVVVPAGSSSFNGALGMAFAGLNDSRGHRLLAPYDATITASLAGVLPRPASKVLHVLAPSR
jgi:hypothetical protein